MGTMPFRGDKGKNWITGIEACDYFGNRFIKIVATKNYTINSYFSKCGRIL